MSTTHTPWHLLPLSQSIPSAPPLLVQSSFTESSYEIYVTDLSRVWIEKLSHAEIVSHATRYNTTIDPSEDASQLKLLLEKLETSLFRPSYGGNVDLKSTPKGDLHLTVRHVLPTPLPELQWTFFLELGNSIDFTNSFVLPLISLASSQTEKIASLLMTIKQKDHILEKCVAKLEESKVDAKTIVGIQRRKGLERFNQQMWEEDMRCSDERRPTDIVGDVFREDITNYSSIIQPLGENTNEWQRCIQTDNFNKIPSIISERPSPKGGTSINKVPTKTPVVALKCPEVDSANNISNRVILGKIEGKKTPTPPKHDATSLAVSLNEETEDSEEEQSEPVPKKMIGKIGKIGGKKTLTPSKHVSPCVLPESPPAIFLNEETEDSEEQQSKPVPKKMIGKIGKVGKISGKKPASPEQHQSTSSKQAIQSISPPLLSPAELPSTTLRNKSLEPEQEREQGTEDENEDERADRKRKQLEKELETKKKIQKRKRKF
ncbi:XRCC4-like factor-domain-containing protein [Geopyxis carbonaria]|nr:XRCC4-like factor-domain-containing protein [Geopyxis carbonaria]